MADKFMMNQDDAGLYIDTAEKLFPEPRLCTDLYYSESKLDEALGCNAWADYCNRGHSEDKPMSPEFRNLLEMLSGPHGLTILKAYRAKRGLDDG